MEQTNSNVVSNKRPPLQKWAIIGFIAFFILGWMCSMPVLNREGAVIGFYTAILYLVVVMRLLYGVLNRNMKVADYILWVGAFALFFIFTLIVK